MNTSTIVAPPGGLLGSALRLLDEGVPPARAAALLELSPARLAGLVLPSGVRITGRRPWTAGMRVSPTAEAHVRACLARGQSLTSIAAETAIAFELVRALAVLS